MGRMHLLFFLLLLLVPGLLLLGFLLGLQPLELTAVSLELLYINLQEGLGLAALYRAPRRELHSSV